MELINLSHYGIIKISGAAAGTFLQGQLTCDINEITSSTFRLTGYCNPQGRLWFVGRIWLQDDHYFLHLPQEIIPAVITDLSKYALFSKVTVEAVANYASLAIIQTDETATKSELVKQLPQTIFTLSEINTCTILCVNLHQWLLIGPKDKIEIWYNTFSQQHFQIASPAQWELAEIQAGIPTIWKSTLNQFLPHDLNLPELGAVNFNKGCYKGQEIIARMQYRGQRKKHLYYAHCDATEHVLPGTSIIDETGKNVGEVVNATKTEVTGYELLAVLNDGIVEQQLPVLLQGNVLKNIKLALVSKK